ncbi:hypothetical protein VNO78_04066 [Psophocarpus tetragonolobus]|uniref:Uncharacterized protein n=1 Tax=Psophocarpus tetragonolobus TaxID=3891 RepID=A0AAN9TEE4_PSOTE
MKQIYMAVDLDVINIFLGICRRFKVTKLSFAEKRSHGWLLIVAGIAQLGERQTEDLKVAYFRQDLLSTCAPLQPVSQQRSPPAPPGNNFFPLLARPLQLQFGNSYVGASMPLKLLTRFSLACAPRQCYPLPRHHPV